MFNYKPVIDRSEDLIDWNSDEIRKALDFPLYGTKEMAERLFKKE
jgi:hypothetical protein